MSVKIRLKRIGAKKSPFYRVVVTDSRSPRDGRDIEQIGYYNPMKEPEILSIEEEKAKNWMAKGAKCSDRVASLFVKMGLLDKSALPVRPTKPAKPKTEAASASSAEAQA